MMKIQKVAKYLQKVQQNNKNIVQAIRGQFSSNNQDENNVKNGNKDQNLKSRDQKSAYEAYTNYTMNKTTRQYQQKEPAHFELFDQDKLKIKSRRDYIFQQFQKFCEEDKLNTKEFEELKPELISLIKDAKLCKMLAKYYKQLNRASFYDREIINVLAEQTLMLKSSFEAMDISSMVVSSSFFNNKYPFLDRQYHELISSLLETTLRSIVKLEQVEYRQIEFGFNGLSKVYIEDYTLYDSLMDLFEKNVDVFSHYQFVSIIDKIFVLQGQLGKNQKYSFTRQQVKNRLKNFMQLPKVVDRVLQITSLEIKDDEQSLKKYGQNKEKIPYTIAKLASLLSRQLKLLVVQNKVALGGSQSQSDQNGLDDSELDLIKDELSVLYENAWKQIEKFTLKNYKILDDKNFCNILVALNSTRTGSLELYTVLLDEFYYRVSSRPLERTNNDFYCNSLRAFYTSRIQPMNLEKYESEFSEFTKKKFSTFSVGNKMTSMTSYSNIGDSEMVNYMLSNITLNEIKLLNKKGQSIIYWSMCNVGIFKEEFFEDFLLNNADPQDIFYGENPQQLVQVTQILQITKLKQKEFWKNHKEILDKKFEEFSEMTYLYHSMYVQKQSQYKMKVIGSFDISDLLNSMGVEFYYEPIVDKIFNVDFILKGITEAKIEEFVNKKQAIATQFRDLSFKNYASVKKFDQDINKINKKSDILLEIDGKTHFLSKNIKRQATNCKIDTLENLGYKVVSIDTFELQKLAQQSDRIVAVEHFIKLLASKIIKKKTRVTKGSKQEQDKQFEDE